MLGFAIHKNNSALAIAEINSIVGKGRRIGDMYAVHCAFHQSFQRLAFTKEIYDLSMRKQLIADLNKINQFDKRRAHLLPFGHPAMTHPRVARAMVNLSGAKTIFDPFCGAGGILIEAGLCGVTSFGSDIDPLMVKRTQKNVHFFGLSAAIRQQDAMTFIQKARAVVTDLPYGISTRITDDIKELYMKFLKNVKRNKIKTAVIGFPDFVNYKRLARDAGFAVEKVFTYYLHKNLSKKIVVMRL